MLKVLTGRGGFDALNKLTSPSPSYQRINMKIGRKYLIKKLVKPDKDGNMPHSPIREWEVLNVTNTYAKVQDKVSDTRVDRGLFTMGPDFKIDSPFWISFDEVYAKYEILEEL